MSNKYFCGGGKRRKTSLGYARFRFLRAFVNAGGRQFPQQVRINGKFYNFGSAKRSGNNMVYTYEFDDLNPISFELTPQENERIAALGVKHERIVMARLRRRSISC